MAVETSRSGTSMGFSQEWDAIYREGKHLSSWPWSDLVSLVYRHANPMRPGGIRVLELGCGAGANIPLFVQSGAQYYGIDGSQHVIRRLQSHYPAIGHQLAVADFTREIPFSESFDLIVDRASVTCNDTASIRRTLALLKERLAPDGVFIGVDWYSTEHSDFTRGNTAGDPYTRTAIPDGTFKDIGQVHFSDRRHLEDLFSDFTFVWLEHKRRTRTIPLGNAVFAAWDFVVRKRSQRPDQL